MVHKYDLDVFAQRYDLDTSALYEVLDLLPKLGKGVWVAGGAIRRILQKKPIDTDIDFFFSSEDKRDEFEQYLITTLGEDVEKISSNNHQTTYKLTITEHDDLSEDFFEKDYKIQLVHMNYYKDVEECLDSFDFTITQFAYDGTHLYCGEYSLWDLANNKLVIHKLTYGLSSFRRVIKYTKQGYNACSGMLTDFLNKIAANPDLIQSDIEYVD